MSNGLMIRENPQVHTLTVYDWNIKILAATSKEKFYRVRRL